MSTTSIFDQLDGENLRKRNRQLEEENAVLKSQVENANVTLEQSKLTEKAKWKRAGYILAMRLLQSNIQRDVSEDAAIALFTKP